MCLWSSSVAVCRPLLDKVQRDDSVLQDNNILGEWGSGGEREGERGETQQQRIRGGGSSGGTSGSG